MDGLVTCRDYFSIGGSGDVVLYKLSKGRSTVADNARSLAIQMQNNTELRNLTRLYFHTDGLGMSPFLVINSANTNSHLMLSTFRAITNYIEAQDRGLPCLQENVEKARITAMTSLVNNIVVAEQYYIWIDYETYSNNTLLVAGSDKVWPLNVIVPAFDRMGFIWNNLSLYRTQETQVMDDYKQSLWSLSQLLGEDNSFSSSGKCSLDALIYGHIEAIRDSNISKLSTPLHQHPNLLQFIDTIRREHFNIGMVVVEE